MCPFQQQDHYFYFDLAVFLIFLSLCKLFSFLVCSVSDKNLILSCTAQDFDRLSCFSLQPLSSSVAPLDLLLVLPGPVLLLLPCLLALSSPCPGLLWLSLGRWSWLVTRWRREWMCSVVCSAAWEEDWSCIKNIGTHFMI